MDLKAKHLDVNTTFLHGDLEGGFISRIKKVSKSKLNKNFFRECRRACMISIKL